MEQCRSLSEHIGRNLSKVRDRLSSFTCTCTSISLESPRLPDLGRNMAPPVSVSVGGSTYTTSEIMSTGSLTESVQQTAQWMIVKKGRGGDNSWANRTLEAMRTRESYADHTDDIVSFIQVVWDAEFTSGRRSWPLIVDTCSHNSSEFLPNSPHGFDTRTPSREGAAEFGSAPASPGSEMTLEDFDDERDWMSTSDVDSGENEEEKDKNGKKTKGIWRRIRGFFRRFRF